DAEERPARALIRLAAAQLRHVALDADRDVHRVMSRQLRSRDVRHPGFDPVRRLPPGAGATAAVHPLHGRALLRELDRELRPATRPPIRPESWLKCDKGNRSFLILPPEKDFDRDRSSVFSLGVVLWELLAGRRLFKGKTDYETLMLARAAQVPPLADVPPALEAIVRKALAKDLEARYQTVIELGDALEGLRAR
ncbi:MAG TPA: hypothetical protein VL463_11705, partial [Kofleriaceae bacterium]|nr:hypothetical protein [Kofleriaceae bacterium]